MRENSRCPGSGADDGHDNDERGKRCEDHHHGYRMSYKSITIFPDTVVQGPVPRLVKVILDFDCTFSVFAWRLRYSLVQADI